MKNIDLQNTTQRTNNDWATLTPQKTGGELRCPRRVSKAKTLITNKRSQKKIMEITIACICFKSSIISRLVVASAVISFIFRTRASLTILWGMSSTYANILKYHVQGIYVSNVQEARHSPKKVHSLDQGQIFLLVCNFSVFQTYRLNGRLLYSLVVASFNLVKLFCRLDRDNAEILLT
jgi:hypothetical protein